MKNETFKFRSQLALFILQFAFYNCHFAIKSYTSRIRSFSSAAAMNPIARGAIVL